MSNSQQSNDEKKSLIEKMTTVQKQSTGYYIYSIFYMFIWGIAVFLSIRCNGGFDFGAFLAACCCAPFYIVYKLASIPKDVMGMCLDVIPK